MKELTQNRLKYLVDYDCQTGNLVRRVDVSRLGKKGNILRSHDCKGYLRNRIDGRLYFVHRLVWLFHHGEFPINQIDHINGIKDDNRIENLRLATNSQNTCNRSVRRGSGTGIKGVTEDKRNKTGTKRWRAHIGINGARKWLGYFNSKDEAHRARIAASHLHGAFAKET